MCPRVQNKGFRGALKLTPVDPSCTNVTMATILLKGPVVPGHLVSGDLIYLYRTGGEMLQSEWLGSKKKEFVESEIK